MFLGVYVMVLHCEDNKRSRVDSRNCVKAKSQIPKQRECKSDESCRKSKHWQSAIYRNSNQDSWTRGILSIHLPINLSTHPPIHRSTHLVYRYGPV